MKRLPFLLLLFLFSTPLLAQSWSGRSSSDARVTPPYRLCVGEDNGKDVCMQQSAANIEKITNGSLDFALVPTIISKLPAASGNSGRVYRVTDGTSLTDCAGGGGSTSVVCVSDGTQWAALGGGVQNVTVAPSGACTNGVIPQMVISTGVLYTCQAGTWGAVTGTAAAAGNTGQYQINIGGLFNTGLLSESNGELTNSGNGINRGPNPNGVDIRAFGAVAINKNSIPAPTGTITGGTNSLTVSSVSPTWVKGMGIAVNGAGATQTMTTPTAPTVTPSCAASWTGLGYTVPAGTGATAYQYQLAMRDQNQGYTAASTAGTTSTGTASLGANSLTITSIAAGTGQQKTVLVSGSTANLAVGCMVYIDGTTDDGEFAGMQIIDGIPDGAHFTYTNGVDVARGITATTATGGNAFYWLCNHLVLPTPGAGGKQYWIYGRTSGSNVYLGSSLIANLGFTDAAYLTWDDYGSTMMASPPTSWFIPTAPPATPQNDTLTTKVTNISGSVFTLADNAVNSVTSQPTRFDNVAAIQAAITASGFGAGGGGTIRFPAYEDAAGGFCFVTSSYLAIPSVVRQVYQDGPVCPGDTIQLTNITTWAGTGLDSTRMALPQFAGQPEIPILSQGANPVMFINGGGNLTDVGISVSGNGGIGVFKAADAGSFVFENLNLSSTGSGDYMSIPFYDYQSVGSGSFGGAMNKVLCSTGPNQTTGVTMTPCMAFKYNNEWELSNISLNRRGIAIVPYFGMGFDITMNRDAQGLITPMFGISQEIPGLDAGYLKLHNLYPDTSAFPLLANMSPASGGVGFSVLIDSWNGPSSQGPVISGKTFTGGVTLSHGVLGAVNEKVIGQNVSVNWIGGNAGNNPGFNITALRQMNVHYSTSHTLAANEASATADATLTFTVDCTIKNAVWDVYSQAGTTTLAPSAGCTLYGNGSTGSFTIPPSQGVRVQVDNQGGAARAGGGVGGGAGGCGSGGSIDAIQYLSATGPCAFGGLNSPIVNGNYLVNYNVNAGAAVAPTANLPGVCINPQTGTTYTFLYSDRGCVITANNAGAQTYTLVNPSSTGFGQNYFFVLKNIGTGVVTLSAGGFTINGATTLIVPPNWTIFVWSDGVNYFASRLPDFTAFTACVDTGGNHLNFDPAANPPIFCGTSASGNGLSGMTTGQVAIAASATSVTSSKALAGAGTGITTGPTTSTTLDLTEFTGTAGQVADAGILVANLVRKDAANTMGAFLTDFSVSTWKFPQAAGGTAGATSNCLIDTTNKNLHCYMNNADAIVLGIPAAPTTGDLADYSVVAGNVLAHDSGILTANVVTQTSNAASGQVCTYTGANKVCVPATALPNGVTGTTQAAASNDTKVATDAYVDGHFIANGTAAMGTSAITSGSCATVVTVSATGTATTDVITVGFNTDPTAITGYGASATGAVLTIYPYPTTNNVNFKVCNSSSGSITPSALTINWKVVR